MESLKIALTRRVAFHPWTPVWFKRWALKYVMRRTMHILKRALKNAATSYRMKA